MSACARASSRHAVSRVSHTNTPDIARTIYCGCTSTVISPTKLQIVKHDSVRLQITYYALRSQGKKRPGDRGFEVGFLPR